MKRHWIQSALVDTCTILSGLALCLVFVLFQPFSLDVRIAMSLFAFDRVLAFSHSWSTTYMVVGSKLFAPLRKKSPERFFYIPVLIFLFSIIIGILVAKTVSISSEGDLDWNSFLYYVPFIGLFMVGHFWHFGRQDFGVLSLYRFRAKQVGPRDRKVDEVFMWAMMYVIQPIMYFHAFPKFPFSVLVNWLTGIFQIVDDAAFVSLVVAIVLFVGAMIYELRKPNRSIGKCLYYVVMLFHPVFLYFTNTRLLVYWHFAYLWSHWIIAVALTTRVNVAFHRQQGCSQAKSWLNHGLVIGGVVALVSLIVWPFEGLGIFNKDFDDARELLRTLPQDRYLIVGLFFGYMLGEQLVHYYCDGCLFRFRDERVRKVVAPLLTERLEN